MNNDLLFVLFCAISLGGLTICTCAYIKECQEVNRLQRENQELKEKNEFIQEQTALIIREVRLIKEQNEKQTK